MVIIHLLELVVVEHFVVLNGISQEVEARKNVSSILSVSVIDIMHLSFE
jgi:hypothetical protein